MQTVIEQLKTHARYAAGAFVDIALAISLASIESLARALFPNSPPITLLERMRILELCEKVERLSHTCNESDGDFENYTQARDLLLAELTTERVRQLATFAGMRDPEDVPSFAQRTIDGIEAITDHLRDDLTGIRRAYEHQAQILIAQRNQLASATSAALDVARAGEWCTDLAMTIKRIGADRDQLSIDRDNLRALLEGKRVRLVQDGGLVEIEPGDAPAGTFDDHGS